MTDFVQVDQLLSALRHGQSCLMLNENSAGGVTGFVVVGAEHCEADHIAFMARQARGLVCLAMTPARCAELELPLMVEGDDSQSPFTLSIEAATGIDTDGRTVTLGDASASGTVHPDGMDFIKVGHSVILISKVADFVNRGDIPIHRVNRFEHNDFRSIDFNLL